MRLRQIEVFRAVMQTGSASQAARLLNVSQPVVSRVLQHAELQLGLPLFERQRGRLVPTPEARALYVQVQRTWSEVERIDALASNLRRGSSGLLRVAATPSLASSLLPQALQALRDVHPDAECDLWASHTGEIEAHLLAYEVDVGFSIEPAGHVALSITPMIEGEMVLTAPRAWTDGVMRLADRAWLVGRPYIELAEATALGERLAAQLSQADWRAQRAYRVQTYALAGRLVEQGLGYAFVDAYTAAQLDPLRVIVVGLSPAPRFELCMMRGAGVAAPALVGRLETCLRETARECARTLAGRLPKARLGLGGDPAS